MKNAGTEKESNMLPKGTIPVSDVGILFFRGEAVGSREVVE
jgi:hypothetical protein